MTLGMIDGHEMQAYAYLYAIRAVRPDFCATYECARALDGQTVTAFSSTRFDDISSVPRSHAGQEAVHFFGNMFFSSSIEIHARPFVFCCTVLYHVKAYGAIIAFLLV